EPTIEIVEAIKPKKIYKKATSATEKQLVTDYNPIFDFTKRKHTSITNSPFDESTKVYSSKQTPERITPIRSDRSGSKCAKRKPYATPPDSARLPVIYTHRRDYDINNIIETANDYKED